MSQLIPTQPRALPPLLRGSPWGLSRRNQLQCGQMAWGRFKALQVWRAFDRSPLTRPSGTLSPMGRGGKKRRFAFVTFPSPRRGEGLEERAPAPRRQRRALRSHNRRTKVVASLSVLAATCLCCTAWAKVETWRQEGPAAFAKAHRDGVVISDNGRIRLGHSISTLGTLGAERVWDLAAVRSGAIYAATGDQGKVFRREAKTDAHWTLAYDSSDSQALALVVGPGEAVYVGTGPTGQVVNITDPAHPASRPSPSVRYIWDLAADAKGNLYAATGPDGQLWKRARDGKWSLLYDSKATHLLCVALGPDGIVFAGSDGKGLVYRITPEGKATILFDAPQSDIRTLLLAGDGALYAGTAAEAGGGSTTRSSMFLTQGGLPQTLDGAGPDRPDNGMPPHRGDEGEPVKASDGPAQALAQGRASPRSAPGGSAAPRPVTAGDNAVYRLDADGVPREVLRVKALIHALCWVDDRLLVGTGPEGQLYEVREHGHDTAPIAKLDHGQILSMLALPGREVVIGTGDPGSVVRLGSGYAPKGELVSEVHDTKLVSRFGTVSWQAELPAGTAAVLSARSGNVGEPDETWSAWSGDLSEPGRPAGGVPPGRFIQYRIKLMSTDPRRTPDLRSVSVNYRTANLARDLSARRPRLERGQWRRRQTRLNIRWDASDPNDDELSFTLKVKKEGWPEWIALNETPITEKSFAWDTTAFPSGTYRLKLLASDRPSNSPDEAQRAIAKASRSWSITRHLM